MMRFTTLVRGAALAMLMVAAGCKSLDITNPNAPDAERALSDPAAIEALAGGAVRVWFNTYEGAEAVAPLVTQAQTYSASWNNHNMNFYSSIDLDGTRNSRSWQNNPSSAARTSIEWFWDGYYRSLSLATNVLKAIRQNGVVIEDEATTKRVETIALLMQGAALSGIAMNYDKGYIVDETVQIDTLGYSDRAQVRDAALAKLDSAIAYANANDFVTPAAWTNGNTYTNEEIAQIASTMAAYLLSSWPRNSTEAAAVDWARVASYASDGISSGSRFTFEFIGDGWLSSSAWTPQILYWFNGIDGGRVHTRVANLLDPATQATPWPAGGNGQPNSPDRRLGDGSFGTPATAASFGTVPRTANGGTDFAWSGVAIFNMARGSYHQSNIGHIRYDLSGVQDPNGIYGAFGPVPTFSPEQNDLMWAEALIESNTNLALAATLINNSRVTRGGLAPATGAETQASLRAKLHYEMEIELLGLGAASFYFRRRVPNGLIVGTPREMPVPAKELGVFGQPLYTWGGATPNSPTPP